MKNVTGFVLSSLEGIYSNTDTFIIVTEENSG